MTEINFTVEFNNKGYNSYSNERKWAYVNNTPVTISCGADTDVFLASAEDKKICIIGKPILDEKINNQEFAGKYLSRDTGHNFFEKINGEFLLVEVDEAKNLIRIVNSRFATPIFWYVAERNFFLGSISYYHLCLRLNQLGQLQLNPEHFYEFLNFRRLFGDKTYDKKSRYLKPAHVLEFSGSKWEITPYWKPSYKKCTYGLEDNAKRLSSAIQTSIRRKMSDNKRYGLFLSGGMDTRTVLAHFSENPPQSFTLTYSKNSREYQVAKTLTSWKGAEHTWIKIPVGHDRKYLDECVKLTGAMYMTPALFLGHRELLKKHIDVLFAGYGFDYFFQGMYLPVKTYRLFGRPLYYRRLYKIKSDLVEYFINNISYRTKGLPISKILKKSKLQEMNNYIRGLVSEIVSEAKTVSENTFDIWEHMTFSNLSRHYTYGGQLQLMTLADYRTISYDNDIYDIYMELPPEQRFDAKILKEVLKRINPKFYNYISANHGFPIKYSSAQRTLSQILGYPKRKIFGKKIEALNEQNFERTWLPVEYVLKNELSDYVESLKDSEELDSLGLFDMDSIRTNVELWKDNKIVGDQTFLVLLTIDRLLKSINKNSLLTAEIT